MIEIELPTALAIYSALLGLLAAGVWLYTELNVRRPQRQLGQQFLWKCTFCGCTYLDEQAHELSKCPRCENFNRADEAAVYQVTDTGTRHITSAAEPISRNTSRRKRTRQRTRGPRRRR